MKVTAQLYGQFLLSSQVNYTGTYLAEHLAGLQHDNVQYFLKSRRFTSRQLWQQVRLEFVGSARGYVLRTVLMDSWYATTALFKQLTQAGKYFYCPLKTRFKRLAATASSMTRAGSSPTSPWLCSLGRPVTWRTENC